MIDADTELKIDGQVLKEKGELLSLTATEAMKTYGTPPQPLLGSGIARDTADLLTQKFGPRGFEVTQLEATWSERLAVFLNGLAPVLLGLGMLALFIEFKTPGFGVFGISGVCLLAIVFLSSSVAGLSGHEPLALFAVGAVLLLLELAFFHSAGFLGVVGFALMAGSLLWAMADLWPNEPVAVAWSADAFVRPLANLGLGLAIADRPRRAAAALFAPRLVLGPHGRRRDGGRRRANRRGRARNRGGPRCPGRSAGSGRHGLASRRAGGGRRPALRGQDRGRRRRRRRAGGGARPDGFRADRGKSRP